MENGLLEQAILERVELIARLASEGANRERDREIALNLIAELFRPNSDIDRVMCVMPKPRFFDQ